MHARRTLDQLWIGDPSYRRTNPFAVGLDSFLRPTRLCRGLLGAVPDIEVRVYVSFNRKSVFLLITIYFKSTNSVPPIVPCRLRFSDGYIPESTALLVSLSCNRKSVFLFQSVISVSLQYSITCQSCY